MPTLLTNTRLPAGKPGRIQAEWLQKYTTYEANRVWQSKVALPEWEEILKRRPMKEVRCLAVNLALDRAKEASQQQEEDIGDKHTKDGATGLPASGPGLVTPTTAVPPAVTPAGTKQPPVPNKLRHRHGVVLSDDDDDYDDRSSQRDTNTKPLPPRAPFSFSKPCSGTGMTSLVGSKNNNRKRLMDMVAEAGECKKSACPPAGRMAGRRKGLRNG